MITALPIIAAVYLGILFILLAAGTWIGVAVGVVGFVGLGFLVGGGEGLFVQISYNQLHSFTLTAVPLFIVMAEVLLRTGITDKLYKGLMSLLSRVPGGLLHVNVISSAVFAAACGSSTATVAAIGAAAVPALEERGYKRRWALGSLAASGTLGMLIPPSIPMILYGFMTDTSVGKLFIGGVIPGVILACAFSLLIAIQSLRNPASIGGKIIKASLRESLKELGGIVPILILIFMVLGSIYMGVATPTEAAGVGAVGSLAIAAAYRKLSWHTLWESLRETTVVMGLIGFIIVGALAMSFSISHLGAGGRIVTLVASSPLPPMAAIFILYFIYILLGCVMDAISLILVTVPIAYPIVVGLGFDPIWFGVILVVILEMAMITPPIGVNLWVLQGLSGESMENLSVGMFPFFIVIVVFLIVLTFVPGIITWLPSLM